MFTGHDIFSLLRVLLASYLLKGLPLQADSQTKVCKGGHRLNLILLLTPAPVTVTHVLEKKYKMQDVFEFIRAIAFDEPV